MLGDSDARLLIHGAETAAILAHLEGSVSDQVQAVQVDTADFDDLFLEDPVPHVAVGLDDPC